MVGKARLALFSDRHVVSQHTEPPGPPPSHRYHHLQGAGPIDRTQIVRVYDSQSPPGEHSALLWKASPEATSGHEGFRKPGGTWVLYKPRVALQPSVVEAA